MPEPATQPVTQPFAERFVEVIQSSVRDTGGATDELDLLTIAGRLALAIVLGIVIGNFFRATYTGKKIRANMAHASALLCFGGCLIWLVVGTNVVRAFGLAGTIGLIRYRTVIRDPKDTTILLFAMVIGMATGLGIYRIAILGTAFATAILFILKNVPVFGTSEGFGPNGARNSRNAAATGKPPAREADTAATEKPPASEADDDESDQPAGPSPV